MPAFKLQSCNVLYPDITPVIANLGSLSTDLTPFIGQIVVITGNPTQSYLVVYLPLLTGLILVSPSSLSVVPTCVPCVSYNSHITLSKDECTCNAITIVDDSPYVNSLAGHQIWGYRRIVVTDPSGAQYVYSSLATENPNSPITPYTNVSVNTFAYALSNTSTDGIYDVNIFSFPTWQPNVMYNSLLNIIVYRNGVLYQLNGTNVGIDPTTVLNSTYWSVYTISDDTLTTRYGYEAKIVVLCISLLTCHEKLVKEAFCTTESNPCGNLCSNKAYMSAIKFNTVMKALEISKCNNDWASVKKQIEILKSICSCGGC